jgi:hypothetical protein
MILRTADGVIVAVISVDVLVLEDYQSTYNLEVEDEHNYFAGADAVLVHNGGPTPEQLLGIRHANTSAHESAKVIQRGQAARARRLVPEGVEIHIPEGDPTRPGNYPHAHGKGWSVNIDGSLHDEAKNTRAVPNDVKKALRKAGWGC